MSQTLGHNPAAREEIARLLNERYGFQRTCTLCAEIEALCANHRPAYIVEAVRRCLANTAAPMPTARDIRRTAEQVHAELMQEVRDERCPQRRGSPPVRTRCRRIQPRMSTTVVFPQSRRTPEAVNKPRDFQELYAALKSAHRTPSKDHNTAREAT